MDLANSVFKEVFRKNLQFLRKSENFTQNELSLECDFSRSYVGKIERGDVDPSLESIQRIAEVLDVNPVLLFVPLADPCSEESGFDGQTQEPAETGSIQSTPNTSEEFLNFLNNRVKNYFHHFKEFYEEAPFGDLIVCTNGEILQANQTFKKLVSSQVPNDSLKDLPSYVHPSDRESLNNFLQNVFSEDDNQEIILQFRRDPDENFLGYVTNHRIQSPETELLQECENSTESSACGGKECTRLVVLDVSQLPTNSFTDPLN